MINQKLEIEKLNEKEDYSRVNAVTHINVEHFSEHNEIEGYFANKDVPEYLGCDRLLKLDTLYGRIQLGYNPTKGTTFIFANMKTSIFDTVSERYQKELKEYQEMKNLKGSNQNISYQARRKENSAMILEKNENKPWSENSISPYILRRNSEALLKTMPFLTDIKEKSSKIKDIKRKKELDDKIETTINSPKERGNISALRKEQNEISHHMDYLNSMITRKGTQSRYFFRKMNYAINMQKNEMFDYYIELRRKKQQEEATNLPVDNNEDNNDK